jgi:ABC-2 type transport system ATP-binding protein
MRMTIITSRGLGRVFKTRRGTVEAVAGVDLAVETGEIVGLLGPNGAGKTTTFRMLTTLLRPTTGTATVAGADLVGDPAGVRGVIGYVPQSAGAVGGGSDPNATVREELVWQGQLYRKPTTEAARRADQLIRQLDLAGLERRFTKTLSGGQRRRLDIALGLVHMPRVIFLDEPSTGLDPQSRSNLWGHIRSLRDQLGTTVFLSTHYLDEADALCDRILVIDHGKVVAEGTPRELKQNISGDIITLSVNGDPGTARAALAGRIDVQDITFSGAVMRLTVPHGERVLPDIMRILDAAGVSLRAVHLVSPTLDDVFLTLTGRGLRDDPPVAAGQSRLVLEHEEIPG